MADLEIAEIFYESGALRYRYARYLAADGSRWVRHGLFVSYQEDGTVASEGTYEHGVEHGLWKDFHPNGQLAARGNYDHGAEVGDWQYWGTEGQSET
ncbi:toxin-antitoxin system YwqK family antitoxin [Ralstonia sp. R-29]|uniref:toxin-antitoxin system YwqK family antitoxin n=1 Tax=Ralstonia sp. R-29 TaxID=3404059 RepID=UPI003CFB3F4A